MQLLDDLKILQKNFGSDAAEMLKTFREEALSLADDTEELLLEMSQPPQTVEFNHLMRNMHTLKGITAQTGFVYLSKIIHSIEDQLVQLKDQKLTNLSSGRASFVQFIDILRSFILRLEDPNYIEAIKIISNEIEISSKALIRSLQESEEAQTTVENRNPAPSETKEATRALSYSLENKTFDKILAAMEAVLVKLFQKGEDADTMDALKILQEAVFNLISARTSSGKTLSTKFKRLVKDTQDKLGKNISFQVNGFDTRIDNNLLMALSECMGHMLKNSVDHGVELPDERQAAGKAPAAQMTLEHQKLGDRTIVTLSDDGRGLDPEKITAIAIQKGLITRQQADQMTSYEKQELIFRPGFSTKAEATEISGRGVGMDAVIHEINRVGGKLTFSSQKGQGTVFHMEFPAPYQLEPMTIFRYQSRSYAVPARFVRGFILDPELVTLQFGTAQLLNQEETYTLLALTAIDAQANQEAFRPLILLELAGAPCALMIDAYCTTQSIFVIPISGSQALPPYLRGAASDPLWGAIFCIDCVEIERNLNSYIPSTDVQDTASTAIDEDRSSTHTLPHPSESVMKPFVPLQGRKATKVEILNVLEGQPFLQKMGRLVSTIEENADLQDAVLNYIAREVDDFKDSIDSVNDIDELQYLLAICYTQVKAKWIQFNTKLNYMNENGLEPAMVDIYKAASLTQLLDLIEPLTHPDAVRTIAITLGQTFRELNEAA